MTEADKIRSTILTFLANNPGKAMPFWETLGGDYYTVNPVLQSLKDEGIVEYRKVPSASGKTMQTRLFLVTK